MSVVNDILDLGFYRQWFFSPNEYLAPRSSLLRAGGRKLLTASKAAEPFSIRLTGSNVGGAEYPN